MSKCTGIILLAAGASTRMGSPKQLLDLHGDSVLRHIAKEALKAECGPILLVLGAYADEIKNHVKDLSIEIVMNANWPEGMGSSIRTGIEALQTGHPACTSALIMATDQPDVSSDLITRILKQHQDTAKPIVACRYGDGFGPPVLFQSHFFPGLLALKGDTGAKALVKQHIQEVTWTDFEQGIYDLDTKTDYEQFIKRRTHDN